MGQLDFKLNMYFQLYKDTPLENRGKFRELFRKKHGEFRYINELVVMIERYQIDKYGELLYRSDDRILKTPQDNEKASNASNHRKHYKRR